MQTDRLDFTNEGANELIETFNINDALIQVNANRKELTEIQYLEFIITHTETLINESAKHGFINKFRAYTHILSTFKDYLSIISDTENKEFVTVEKCLKLHPTIKKNNIYFWIRIKKLKAYKFNKKHTLIRLSEIQKLKK
jgi:hypothetical protein